MASKDQLNRQKESIRLEKEYQQATSFSAQIQRDINKEINKGVDARTKLGKSIREYNKELTSSLSSIQSSEDAVREIVKLEDKNKSLAKQKNGYNKKEIDAKIKNNNFAIEGLKLEQERIAASEELDKVQKGVAGGILKQIDSIEEFGSNIPIIGGLFSQVFGGAFEGLRSSVTDAGKEMVTQFSAGGMSLKNMTGALSKFGGSVMAALANPMVLAGIAVAAVAAGIISLVGSFIKLDEAGKSFRNETGLLNSQTGTLAKNIKEVKLQSAALGASYEDIAQAAAAFTNVFEGTVQPSKEVLANVVTLEKNFGVAADGAAKVNLMFQSIGGLSETAAQSLITSTAEAAKLVGVSPDRVIKDLAENAETAAIFFQGSVGDLAKAAVEAARLGTSLTQAAAVANNLLDFENSITAELEASAMLGQSINFNKARELAANKDIIGAQQAVLDEASKIGNLNELNTFQLESIAKASGMEVGELQKQIKIREKFGSLNGEQAKALEALAAKGNEIKDISKEQLASETARIAKQQEFQSQVDQVKNQFGALGVEITAALTPLIGLTIPVLKGIVGLFKLILSPVTFLATQLGRLVEFLTKFKDVAAVAATTFIGIAATQDLMTKKSKIMLGYEIAKNAATSVYNGLITFGNTIKKKGLLTSVYEMASSAFSSVAKIPFIGPILGAAAAAAALALGMGYVGKADDMFSPGGGASGYGSRTITSAAGTLALNNQDDVVAGTNLMGGGGGGSAVVSAIEKLGADIRALQVIVNLDGRKVTEGVSKVVSRNQTNSTGVTV